MELTSPRHDPFSEVEVVKSEFRKEGYDQNFSVTDENHCKDDSGNTYKSDDLVINEVRRLIHKNVPSNSLMIHAIAAKSGAKGLLITHHPSEEADEVTDQFLLNVDKNDQTKPMY